MIKIYTDGACSGNPGIGGWGVVILENNKDNKEIGKIFQNVGNNMDFEKSMRQFHINPSTTIPNNQDDFLEYCYKDLYSEKPLLVY